METVVCYLLNPLELSGGFLLVRCRGNGIERMYCRFMHERKQSRKDLTQNGIYKDTGASGNGGQSRRMVS